MSGDGRCRWTVKGVLFQCPAFYQPLDTKAIGTGAYAVVAGAVDTRDGSRVAIKRCSKVLAQTNDTHQATLAKRMLREMLLLRALDHPNVINIVHMWHNANDVYLAEPLMEADLHRVIRSSQALSDDHFQFFAWQIFRALKYMHSANVIHRDLKPANILVNSNCDIKICDFGLARAVEEEELDKTMYVVTRWYRAPELMIADDYSEAVDMWAVGCIIAEFLGRRALFPGKSSLHQMQLITSVLGPIREEDLRGYKQHDQHASSLLKSMQSAQDIPVRSLNDRFPRASPKALDLLKQLLVYHPAKRPRATAALEHPWLQEHHSLEAEPSAPARLDFEFDHLRNAKAADLCKLVRQHAHELGGAVDPSACHIKREDLKLPPINKNSKTTEHTRSQTGLSPSTELPGSPKSPQSPPITIGPEEFHSITAYDRAQVGEEQEEQAGEGRDAHAAKSCSARNSDAAAEAQRDSKQSDKCTCRCLLM